MLRFALVLAVSLLALPAAAADEPPKPVATLGVAKVWGAGRLSASADGRTVIVGTQWYDWRTGDGIDPPCQLPVKADWHALLTDGRIAVCKDQQLAVHDPKSGAEVAKPSGNFWHSVALSGDAGTVAQLVHDPRGVELHVGTAADGYKMRAVSDGRVGTFRVSADGSRVVWYEDGRVRLYAVAAGDWLELNANGEGDLAVSSDGGRVAVLTKTECRLFDAITGKRIRDVDPPVGFKLGYRAEFTADGKYVVGFGARFGWALFPTAGDGKAVVANATAELGELDGRTVLADGKRLLLKGPNGVVRLYDLLTGKRLDAHSADLPAYTGVKALDDRRALAWADDGRYAVWDIRAGKAIRTAALPDRTPAGGTPEYVAWRANAAGTEFAARVSEAALGVHVRTADGAAADPDAKTPWVDDVIAFLPDGRTVRARNTGSKESPRAELRDVATGKRVGLLNLDALRLVSVRLAVDPAARTVAFGAGSELRLYELATGNKRWVGAVSNEPRRDQFPFPRHASGIGFSAGGRRFAAVADDLLAVYDTVTRDCLFTVPLGHGPVWAMSRDGRWFAWKGQQAEDSRLRLVDLTGTTGDAIALPFDSPGRVRCLDVTPDAKHLLVVPAEGPIQVWDVSGFTRQPAKGGAARTAAADPWDMLASADAPAADHAMTVLIRAPAFALAQLGERLTPVATVDAVEIARHIAALGSKDYAAREAAGKALAGVADQADTAARQALKAATNPETRRRLEKVVAAADAADERPDTLRAIRALEVLEAIGGTDARAVVAKLAGGAPGARATLHAQATLKRMK